MTTTNATRAMMAAAAIAGMSACAPPSTPVTFTVPNGNPETKFLDTPWPSDVMITDDGGLDLSEIPNPFGSDSLEDVIRLFQTNTAYPASSNLYFRIDPEVDGGLDDATLPAGPADSLVEGSSMFLVEADTLRRIPIEHQYYVDGTSFLPAGSIAVQPLLGAVPHGRYALVVTSNARTKNGNALGPSSDLQALLDCRPLPAGARKVDCAPYQKLVDDLGLPHTGVALVQMVTPGDAVGGLIAAADVVRARGAPPIAGLTKRDASPSSTYEVYDGVVTLAILQAGTAPYDTLDPNYVSGGFVLDGDGKPIVQNEEDVPFVLTVPARAPPADGFCVVVYGHGTGGDLESGLGSGPSSEAFQLTGAGCAMLAISEPLHRTRLGYRAGQEEVLTFNFFNPVAGRDNWRESAAEKVQLVSLAQALSLPASLTGRGDIHFDPSRVGYFGHSQGGIIGALFTAVEHRINGSFLSGVGAGFQASLVEKIEPQKIADVIKTVLSYPSDSEEEVDRFHPAIALLQSWVDPADPLNYGEEWSKREGPVPSLVVTSGLLDDFTPPRCHGALAGSWHIPLVKPVSKDIEVLDLEGIKPVDGPIHGNFTTVDGDHVTAGMLQYPDDGHFAVFDNPGAQAALRAFFTTLNDPQGDGLPEVRVR